jgi:hypothetical protein
MQAKDSTGSNRQWPLLKYGPANPVIFVGVVVGILVPLFHYTEACSWSGAVIPALVMAVTLRVIIVLRRDDA